MADWQTLLSQGNCLYRKGAWEQAEYCYLAAQEKLNRRWQQDQTNVELLLAWVCSSHNLAAVYEQQGDHRVSLQYLLYPHQRVLKLSEGQHGNNDLTLLGIKTLSLTLKPILAYRQKHALCQDCYHALVSANSMEQRQKKLKANAH